MKKLKRTAPRAITVFTIEDRLTLLEGLADRHTAYVDEGDRTTRVYVQNLEAFHIGTGRELERVYDIALKIDQRVTAFIGRGFLARLRWLLVGR